MVLYIRQQKATSYGGTVVGDDAFDKSEVAKAAGATSQIMGAINAAKNGNIASHFGSDVVNKINSGLNQINSSTNGALSGLTSSQ
jgi:hypothetical protein